MSLKEERERMVRDIAERIMAAKFIQGFVATSNVFQS